MDSENIVCPVCTLFLRPGITLKSHLTSHPKQKVIEALVRLSNPDNSPKIVNLPSEQNDSAQSTSNSSSNQIWNQAPMPVNTVYPNFGAVPGNHSFIYQQFMSSSTPQPNVLNVNPLTQQVVTIPTVFNSQMMCPPYVYQQQQVIMSSGPSIMPPLIPKPLSIEMPSSPQSDAEEQTDRNAVIIEDEETGILEPDQPDLVSVDLTSSGNISVTCNSKTEDSEFNGDKLEIDDEDNIKIDLKSDCEETVIVKGDVLKIKTHNIDDEDPIVNGSSNSNDAIAISECVQQDHGLDSPHSVSSDWTIKMSSDLDKSCQTQAIVENLDQLPVDVDNKPDCYYTDMQEDVVTSANYAILQNSYNQNDSVYTVAANHNESLYASHNSHEQTNLIDMDGMNLLISNEYLNNQLVSQVEDFECVSSERPRVLMNIGAIETNYTDNREVGDESMSRENANIRADEHMPPRGELSGQESNGGTSDMNWNRIPYQEGSCGMSVCTSYDLIARETWNGSDMSDTETPPVHTQSSPIGYISNYDNDDTPTVSGFREPPITYKCPTCGESFNCPKERRVHLREYHETSKEKEKEVESTVSEPGNKRVKKLTIKPKKSDIKTENNFDNVFTNKLKIEENAEENFDRVSVILPPNNSQLDVQKMEVIIVNNPIMCTTCDTILSDNNALKQHRLEVHKFSTDVKYKCKTCEQTFPNEAKYTEHLKNHPLECRLCGKYFYRRQNMQLHMKRHLGIKPYKCNICEKAFLTKQKHDEHKNIHTGEAPIKCTLCEETFRRHSNLVQHKNRHHFNLKKKLKDYVCFCGDVFHSMKKLAWHKEIHDVKPKACSQCSEKFVHMSSLTRHMRRAHNERFVPVKERATENVECPICKGVYLRSSLEVHIRNHSGQRPYSCLICNKEFTTKWNLKLHKWTHASRTSKPFKCDQCKGAFIRESDYVAHMNSHKSVKPYTCNYCGAQFIRKYNCQRHVKEHEKVKTFKCQVCGKCFHRSYYLKDHMRVHSGLRPYTCHICGKTSTTKSNHNKHVRIHHAREPVSTEN